MVVAGAQPEAIKMAPVYLAVQVDSRADARLLAVAQHRQMLDHVLSVFGIRPDIDLDLMRPGQTLSDITSRAVIAVQQVLAEWKPGRTGSRRHHDLSLRSTRCVL